MESKLDEFQAKCEQIDLEIEYEEQLNNNE
jgi:hypothetical protein